MNGLPVDSVRGRIRAFIERHAHLLGVKDTHMHRVLPTLVEKMGETYPELREAESMISQSGFFRDFCLIDFPDDLVQLGYVGGIFPAQHQNLMN